MKSAISHCPAPILTALLAASLPFAAAAATVDVMIMNSAFHPQEQTIQVGDTVRWIQHDNDFHTVTSGENGVPDGTWDSDFLGPGAEFSRTFNQPGTFPYFCTPHPDMTGRIIVEGASTSGPSIQIVEPEHNAVMTAPGDLVIRANASSEDASITKVEFFQEGTLVGELESEPYRIIIRMGPGIHTLTARATDSEGMMATSQPATITVQGESTRITDPIPRRISKGDLTIELQLIASGMISPLGLADPNDGSGRLFVYDQGGLVHVIAGGERLPAPMLDVRTRLVSFGNFDERGLLGLAVHPHFTEHPLLYTYTSEPTGPPADFMLHGSTPNHQSVIAEWRIDSSNPNAVDPASRREIMRIDQPQSNHNGGTIRFGPDGYLYIALGDGGGGDDQGAGHSAIGNGQDKGNLYGSIVRIDVNGRTSPNGQYAVPADNPFVGKSGLDEIYAWGFRNPYSFSFDSVTGHLHVADVGQNDVEELNLVFKGGNYGWPIKEGTFFFDNAGTAAGFVTTAPVRPVPHDLIDPIAQYPIPEDGRAIIAGAMYRGTAIPALSARFVAGDWGTTGPSGRLFYLDRSVFKEFRIGHDDRPLGIWLKGMGQDNEGEVYVFGSMITGPSGDTGVMYKIVPLPQTLALTASSPEPGQVSIDWAGGIGPFVAQSARDVSVPDWRNVSARAAGPLSLAATANRQFFRVADVAGNPPIPFTAHLTGQAERPSPVTTAGIGRAILSLEGNTLHFNVHYSGLSSTATAAHIHGPGTVEEAIGILVDLGPYNGGQWGASGVLFGSVDLTPQIKAHLLDGRTYLNIHTVNHGPGEIRGQIAPVVFTCNLDGASEAPESVDTPATGSGILFLAGNELTLNLSYRDLKSPATAAHIHGPASESTAAGILIDLGALHGGAFGTDGYFSGTVTLTPQQLGWLLDRRLYINVHTAAHPPGEIRGQLLPRTTAVPLTAPMSGDWERPVVDTSASGAGSLFLEGNRLHFELNYTGLSGTATAAHIHGPADTTFSIGILVDLDPYQNGAPGTRGAFSGSVLLTDRQRAWVAEAKTYVNVHTAMHPPGEIRGQLAPSLMHSTLAGSSVRPVATQTAASGMGHFLLIDRRLHVNVSYAGFPTAPDSSEIFGPAGVDETAPAPLGLADLPSVLGASGGMAGSILLDSAIHPVLVDERGYVSIRTPERPGGLVRGQIGR